MSWPALVVFAAGTYALRVLGPIVFRPTAGSAFARLLELLPVAMLAGLVALALVPAGGFELDGRVVGALAAAGALVLRARFLVVVLLAAAVAAAWRALDLG